MTHWGHVRSPFWKRIIMAALKLVREIKTCKRSPDEVSRRLSTGSWSKQRLSQSECLDANQDRTRVFGPQSEKGNGHFHGETKLNAPLLFPFKCEPEAIFKSLQQKCKASRANAVQPSCPCHALPALQTLRSNFWAITSFKPPPPHTTHRLGAAGSAPGTGGRDGC